ncbi:MAG: CHAT domain-containing protein [Caldilineaceae bacterium]|nr:CHAT domain-containing protein [Caldilineaceae bacterium]
MRARFGVGDGSAAVRIDQLVDVTVVAHATRPRLIQAIEAARRDERDFHVVHFAGHGMADASGSYLFLEQEDSQGDQAGEADPVAAGEFAEMIASDTLSVVFLNACQTAAPLSFFQGAAHAMLQRGVGAVVAMQTPVIDSSALAFARAFYGGWAGGQIVEAALASARRQLAGRAANAADWSVPILYMGPTGTWRLSLAVPALRLPLPLRLVWGLLAGFVTLISVLGVLFTVPDLNRRMRTEVPVVRCVWPYPMDEHQFNVAIAPFTEEDAAGNYRSSGLGAQLAAFAYSRFSPLVDTLELGTPYGLRPPYHTCAVAGNTEEARRAAAQTLAEQIHADVLIYGVIEQSPSGRTFTPEFYVSYRGFGQAVDLTGPYRLGRSVPLPEADLRAALEQDSVELIGRQLVPRYEALSKMTVGLAEYVWDNFDVAIAYFESAIETPDWQDRYGKEIAFLFLGNAYARRAAVTRENEDVTRALESYAAALAINDAFARAKIGEASALYQEALGDLAVLRVQNVNVAALNEAESAALAAQSLPAPAEAYVPLKVDMVIGQIDMVRFYIFGGDWIDKAEERFQNVTAAYDQDPLRTAELVGHAYARLGLIAAIRGDLVAAVAGYEQASALVSHHWQVDYLMRIGDLYVANDQLSEAKGYYERALNAATLYGEETLLEEIESKLDALAGA